MRSLVPRLQKKVIRQAMRRGLKVLKAETEAQAPVDTGETRRNVKVRAVKSRKRGSISLEVRIKAVDALKKTTREGKEVFYPAVVEYKHDPFMKRSFDAKGNLARDVTIQELRIGIDREANRR
jgi:hypothetical protein